MKNFLALPKISMFFILLTVSLSLNAAVLQDDQLLMCDKKLDITPSLRTSTLYQVVKENIKEYRFDLAYANLAKSFEATLSSSEKHNPELEMFATEIRNAKLSNGLAEYDVISDRINGKFVNIIFATTNNEIIIDCTNIKARDVDMAAVSLMTRWVLSQESVAVVRGNAR